MLIGKERASGRFIIPAGSPGNRSRRGVPWTQPCSKGLRGLAGRSSLSRVLEQHRGVPKGYRFSPLTVDRILASMDEHHRQTGWWPNLRSGAVAGAEGENWGAINTILRTGGRGLPAGSSLAKLRAANGARARMRPSCRSSPSKRSWRGPTRTTRAATGGPTSGPGRYTMRLVRSGLKSTKPCTKELVVSRVELL